MKLQDYFGEIDDIDAFWRTAFQLPVPKQQKYSRAKVLSLRFNKDGTVRKTFQGIADALGMKKGHQAREVFRHAIRYMMQRKRKFVYRGTGKILGISERPDLVVSEILKK